jgi:hypothetical protein
LDFGHVVGFGLALDGQEDGGFGGALFARVVGVGLAEGIAAASREMAHRHFPAQFAIDKLVHQPITGNDEHALILARINCFQMFLAMSWSLGCDDFKGEVCECYEGGECKEMGFGVGAGGWVEVGQ